MKTLFVFFLLLIGCANSGFAHSYYVSTTNMEYDEVSQAIEVSLKLTAHDFEHVLEMKYNQRLHIETIADTSEIGLYVQAYLKENFVITSGNEPATFNYVGKEVTLRDELYFYFSLGNIKDPNTIQIKNTLLFTHFAQQQNIVHYKRGEKSKSVTLIASKPEAELKLE